MPPLSSQLRGMLERAVIAAHDEAERAARTILATLAVHSPEPFAALPQEQRRLQHALRIEMRRLGAGSAEHGFELLVEEVAYAQWHRMLFARFLAENDLLMHPSGVAVTLEECAELYANRRLRAGVRGLESRRLPPTAATPDRLLRHRRGRAA
jgi:hypothetical protein